MVGAVGKGVVSSSGGNKVGGDEFGALVNELVERVLAVGTGSTPQDRAGLVINPVAILGDELSVRLHITLLEIIGEFVEVLVVG